MSTLLLALAMTAPAEAYDLLAIGSTRFNNSWSLQDFPFTYAANKMAATSDSTDGYSVDVSYINGPLDYTTLAAYDVLWVGWVDDAPHSAGFTTAELDAIQLFVEDGGIVVAGCDDPEHDAVCQVFGTSTGGTDVLNPMTVTSAGSTHPLFDGPYGLVTNFNGSGVQGWFELGTGQTSLATEANGRPVVVVEKAGNGAAVMLADIDFVNNTELSDATSLYDTAGDQFLGNLLYFMYEFPLPECGNERVDDGEECDDGNSVNTDACLDTCENNTCGDGFVHIGVEDCDDSNNDSTDACLSSCLDATCGDGYVWAGREGCDDAGESADCDADCTSAICGDGVPNASAGEECDDANNDWGDFCSPTCLNDSDGDGVTDIDELDLGLDPDDPDSDNDGSYDGVDPMPADAGENGIDAYPQAPEYGLGCSTTPASAGWLALGLALMGTRRRD